jgi:hypothetical protein
VHRGHFGKKLITLSGMLIEYSEAIEADLARFYPRDRDQLTEWYAGRMTMRRLWVLVSNLPKDSATTIEIVGEDRSTWTTMVELSAQTVDAIKELTHNFVNANSKSPSRNRPPLVPRPAGVQDDQTDTHRKG